MGSAEGSAENPVIGEQARPAAGRASWLWLLVSLAVLVADQFTKYLIVGAFELFERLTIGPFFDLVRLHNTGAAFSFLAGASGWQNWLFAAVAVAVSIAILVWFTRLPAGRVALPLGLALILGGAVGNLIDRAVYGYVIDFVLLHYDRWSYPAFNVADSAITCGVILLLVDGFFLERRRQPVTAGSA
jgi:signal peptidase II